MLLSRNAPTTMLLLTAASLGLTFISGVKPARAQSATTYRTAASFGAINYEDRDAATSALHGYFEQGGKTMSTSGAYDYSFGEGRGDELGADGGDAIRISGSAWGSSTGLGFHDLKAGVSATLENAYLDLRDIENAPEQGGMKAPYYWIADASAAWTMTTKFHGFTVAGNSYTVKWIFGVDGVANDYDAGRGFAYMGFTYGASPRQSFSTTSLLPQMWATASMPVTWGEAVRTNADFHANWQYNMLRDAEEVYGGEDGDELIGYRAPSRLDARVDYASTMKLDEIQVFDQDGNRFYDFWVEDGDGNRIYTANAAVPEPGTLALMGLAGLALLPIALLRRRSRTA